MFKALIGSDEGEVLPIARDLAASDGYVVVNWTEIGLGGIMKISDLFAEFCCVNREIFQLGGNRRGVFDPIPIPLYRQPGDELIVAESAQPNLFKTCQKQLESYRDRLQIA